MKEKDCNLVKDLLPNYIDRVTSDETNIFVVEHLKNCERCRKSFENMSEEMKVDNKSKDNKKINIFRKVNNKIRLLKTIIFVTLFIFLIIFVRKVFIINNIENMSSKANYNCYSKIMVETTEKYTSKIEYYQNNDNFIKINTKINEKGVYKVISYKLNGTEDLKIFDNNIENQNVNKTSIEKDVQYQFLNKSFFGNIGLALSFGSVKDIKLHNKPCYLLNVENYLNFIDKETGLTIKEINMDNNSVINYKYTFGDITDEKIENLINNLKL